MVFALGIFLEDKIKSEYKIINLNPSVSVETETSPLDMGDREHVTVKRVLDGDTIELSDGRKVRYIGINAPEITDKRPEILCFAKMAKAENERLVLGKTIEMEKDVSDKDKYDRLLRYVWVDNQMVNLYLIKNGYAKIATYPPDVKYKDLFLEASKNQTKLICNTI